MLYVLNTTNKMNEMIFYSISLSLLTCSVHHGIVYRERRERERGRITS
jgi:hypothetical protein